MSHCTRTDILISAQFWCLMAWLSGVPLYSHMKNFHAVIIIIEFDFYILVFQDAQTP